MYQQINRLRKKLIKFNTKSQKSFWEIKNETQFCLPDKLILFLNIILIGKPWKSSSKLWNDARNFIIPTYIPYCSGTSRQNIKKIIKIYMYLALTRVVQLVGSHPSRQKFTSWIPAQGTLLGCGSVPQSGPVQEASDQCFSPPLPSSLPFSLKISKYNLYIYLYKYIHTYKYTHIYDWERRICSYM